MCHTFHVYLNFIVIENALIVRVPIGLWCVCKCVCRLEINWFPSNLLLFCQIQSNFSFIFGFVFPNSVPIRTPTYAYYLDGILLVVARMRTECQYFILYYTLRSNYKVQEVFNYKEKQLISGILLQMAMMNRTNSIICERMACP